MFACPSSAHGPRRLFSSLLATAALLAACAPSGSVSNTAPVPQPTTSVETTAPATTPPTTVLANRAAPLPMALLEMASALWDGRIVVAGGMYGANGFNDNTYFYDPATDSWESGPSLPTGVHHTGMAVLGDRMYLVGGFQETHFGYAPTSEVWSLGPGEEQWRPEPALVTPRGAMGLVSIGDGLMAIGGVGPDYEQLATTEILEAGAVEWTVGPELAEPREHLAATAVGDRVYAIGGRLATLDTNKATVEVLEDGEWREGPSLNHARGGFAATAVDGIPCVAGGEEPERTIGSIECLVDGAWEIVGEMEVPRHGFALAYLDGALRIIGGGPQPQYAASTLHEVIPLDFGSD